MKNRFLSGLREAVENAVNTVRDFFRGGENVSPDDQPLPAVQVPDPIVSPPDVEPVEDEIEEPSEDFPEPNPYEGLTPEEIDDAIESDFADSRNPSDFEAGNLRRIFATYGEAVDYASDIPVPTEVFKRTTDGLYQVVVIYP